MEWRSDSSVTRAGFVICFSPASPPSLPPSSPPQHLPLAAPNTTLVECGFDATLCGENLADAYVNASAGDVLVLQDGTYTGTTGSHVLVVNMSITVRALNSGRAILDGHGEAPVVRITSGAVVLDGLHITNGYTIGNVSAFFLCPKQNYTPDGRTWN